MGQKSKLLYSVHIFAKGPINKFSHFSSVDSGRNLILSGMHTTLIMLLHYLVKYKYLKTYSQYLQMVIRSSGKFLKYLSKMLYISYNKCQKGLGVPTE